MLMTAAWKRFVEYWPPFAVLFAAFSLQPWLQGARSTFTHLSTDILDELQPFLDRPRSRKTGDGDTKAVWQAIAIGVVAVLLATALFFNLRVTRNDIASSESHAYYQSGAEWMRANIPAGQLIFNTDWDDFPRLFYYDPSHDYVSGLDPTYLYDKNPAFQNCTIGSLWARKRILDRLIRDRFGARYVFTDNFHHDFFNARTEQRMVSRLSMKIRIARFSGYAIKSKSLSRKQSRPPKKLSRPPSNTMTP